MATRGFFPDTWQHLALPSASSYCVRDRALGTAWMSNCQQSNVLVATDEVMHSTVSF